MATTAFFLIFLFQSYEQKGWFYHWLDEQLIIPRRETYTELYFPDASLLPRSIKQGDEVVLQFTVHNLEGRTMDYPYQVFIRESGTTTQLIDGTTAMGDGESKTISAKLSFARSVGDAIILVRLPKSEKEIRFHIN